MPLEGRLKSRDARGEQFRARRRRLEDAIDALSTGAKSKLLRPSFARMNPAARIRYNAFYFGIAEQAPRAVVRGPWLYIDAPTAKLPNGVESYSEDEGRRTHAGRFNARLLLTSEESVSVLPKTIRALQAAGTTPS